MDRQKQPLLRVNAIATLACQAIFLLGGSGVGASELKPSTDPPCQDMMQPALTLATLETFEALLGQRQTHPEQAAAIDAQIEALFSQELAVMVMDMAGFSRLTVDAGIIPSLAQIYQIRSLTVPLVEASGGRILKLEADNVYAVFPSAEQALMAMESVLSRLQAEDLHASIGIGFGEVLVVGERDVFGHEMNLASKLGEDIAEDDEILLTAAAFAALPALPPGVEPLQAEVSGLMLQLYRVPLQER
ncbi:adenylate/guanylate cyclase domain-containing protein [Pseudanabaena sp. FACHB-2040]|uniref:adenylate/guanylate cyclase domain-containing protein n=1 Tax=Pseudanabaena sp. FACHB-2040 TaxID=2692859 RepID=UPI0016862A09|nr:adenylate/guanylate cyclase domain-containing protein [Pseudanabaena sp. FACHB-2040]MBD2256849.1 adenylate/guanylate cyclase domain-containing protein [Pseudanabaena sp. FACHB-2040]